MQRYYRLFSALILFSGLGWMWVSRTNPANTTQGGIAAPRQGFLAPDFSLQTLQGETVKLSDMRGQPVLVNFWASWCRPCQAEMPAMQRVFSDYQDRGFVVLAVNATNQDVLGDVKAFVQELGLTFPIVLDLDGMASSRYSLRSLPTSFFIDGKGVIREVVIGGPMSEALLRVRVQQLIDTPNSGVP